MLSNTPSGKSRLQDGDRALDCLQHGGVVALERIEHFEEDGTVRKPGPALQRGGRGGVDRAGLCEVPVAVVAEVGLLDVDGADRVADALVPGLHPAAMGAIERLE